MKKKFCRGFLALTFTLLCLKIPAQQALKIGETLPEYFWTTPLQVVNHPEETITLEKDRDKLILLDFWATWCSSCLKNFPVTEALQKKYGNKIMILPVNDQPKAELDRFYATKNGQRFIATPSVTGSEMLRTMFPYKALPYYIWIRDGKVLNTTDGEQVTAANIENILARRDESLQTVQYLDRTRPLMLDRQFDVERGTKLQHYVLFSEGRIRAIAGGSGFRREGDVVYGRQLTNVTLPFMFSAVASELFEARMENYSFKRRVLQLNDTDRQLFESKSTDVPDGELYSLEYIVPPAQAGRLYDGMLQTLSSVSPFKATLETRDTPCWVITNGRGSKTTGAATTGGKALGGLLANLNSNDALTKLPILNESGYSGAIPFSSADITSLKMLQASLKPLGLELREEVRPLLMLVINRNSHIR